MASAHGEDQPRGTITMLLDCFSATGTEHGVHAPSPPRRDPDSSDPDAAPGFNAYSASREVEAQILAMHRAFLHPDGIPSRPWFRNLVVAPGLDLGYGAVTLPALREAMDSEDDDLIKYEVDRLLEAFRTATTILR